MKQKKAKVATTKNLDDGKKYAVIPVGTYVLKRTYYKLELKFDEIWSELKEYRAIYPTYIGLRDNLVLLRFADKKRAEYLKELDQKTETINNLTKEYNNLVNENRELKKERGGLELQSEERRKQKISAIQSIDILQKKCSELKSRIFWLGLVATITTATTVLFVIYHISKAI